MFRYALFVVALALLVIGPAGIRGQQDIPLDQVNLPPGFSIEVYASGLANPRSMVLTPGGTLFVGTNAGFGAIVGGPSPETRTTRCGAGNAFL